MQGGDQVLLGDVRAGLQLDARLDRLSPLRVGHADHGTVLDGGMCQHDVLDLEREDVEAARDDHVALAVGRTRRRRDSRCRRCGASRAPGPARSPPRRRDSRASSSGRGRRARRSRPPAGARRRRPSPRGRRRSASGVRTRAGGDAPLGVAHGVGDLGRRHPGEREAGLGLAVRLADHRPELLHTLDQLLGRDRRGGGDQVAQRARVGLGEAWVGEQDVDQRRRQEQRRHPMQLDQLQQSIDVRRVHEHGRPAELEVREHDHPGGVRDRRDREVDRRTVELPARRPRERRHQHELVRALRQLRGSRRAAGRALEAEAVGRHLVVEPGTGLRG